MAERHAVWDVIIAGGGPAGAAVAILLVRTGLRVLLVESTAYDTFRVGETLPPYAGVLLDELGALERFLGDGARPSAAIHSAWGGADVEAQHFIFNPYGNGWHVDRRCFDAMLASVAEEAGATRAAGSTITRAVVSCDGVLVEIEKDGVRREEHARVVVDATGRSAHVACSLGGRRIVYDRLVGVVGVLGKGEPGRVEVEALLLEALPNGWIYSVPLPDGSLLVAFITDGDELTRRGARPEAAWFSAFAASVHTRERAQSRPRIDAVQVRKASTSRLDCAAGPRWIAVGDAAAAYDPLAADGICRAIRTGMLAATATERLLGGDEGAFSSYGREIDRAFRDYLVQRGRYYGVEKRWPDAVFWQRRSASEVAIVLSPHVTLVAADHSGPDATAGAETLLPYGDVGTMVRTFRTPRAAHEGLARVREVIASRPSDLRLVAAAQLLVERGALRILP